MTDFVSPPAALKISELHGLPCYAVDVPQFPEIADGEATPLREIFQLAGPDTFALADRATQLLDWQANHRFCG